MGRSLATVVSLADDAREPDVDLRSFARALPPRYRVVRPLGHGGFGDVMLVRDEERGEDIAMKRLARMDPASVRRFKHEFRVLQGVRHPALARLHELFSHDSAWFLAMEHIDGEDFIAYVRPGGDAKLAPTLPEQYVSDERSTAPTFDEARLRSTLAQLADGVFALHRGGIIHRDLKPQNVLVDANERVVILDFGLAATIDLVFHHTAEARLAGTPGYMPPEQAQSQPLTRAADWYALGVMLYEALTGRKPFVGSLRDIVDAQLLGAPDPERYGHPIPRDLAGLCRRLLAPRPADRPDGCEVLAILGKPAAPAIASAAPAFVGRAPELAALDAAVEDIAARGPVVIDIVADSGLGKSALVRRAVERARNERGAVVLSTRCYEREALPYKSVDPMVDALTEMLQRRTSDEVLAVMPRDARALCRLFPVLDSIEVFAKAPEVEPIANREVLRRRAIDALRELLGRVADRAPLVVVLDDLHWGDLDGARLLVDLLAGPGAPRMLLVCAYRHLEPGLRALQRGLAAAGVPRTELVLAPLPDHDALALARGASPPCTSADLLARVVTESRGSPMLILELLRSGSGPNGLGLDQVIAARLATLDDDERRVLELIATAGRRIDLRILRVASDLDANVLGHAVARLEEADLVRRAPAGLVEAIHDRVREVAISALAAGVAAGHHRALAEALLGIGDDETVAEHFRLAGEPARARPLVLAAAARAAEALAHERAVGLYQLALSLSEEHERFAVLVALGDTLTFDGRGLEAADAYHEALAHAPSHADIVDLKRKRADQLLRSGRIDEGLDACDDVMRTAKIAIPCSASTALVSLVYQRARLALRGLELPTTPALPSSDARAKLDALWSVGVALAGFDLVKSADLQSRHLRRALATGDRTRVSLGLALEGVMLALDSTKGQRRAAGVIDLAEQLAQELGDPYAMGWAAGAAAVLAFSEGRWRACASVGDYAVALYRARCVDATWEIGTLQSWFRLRALFALGEIATLAEDTEAAEREAERRADLYTLTNLRLGVVPYLKLATGAPANARALVEETIAAWSRRGWHNQHQDALRSHCLIDLYDGDPGRMLARIDEHWDQMSASKMFFMQNERIMTFASQAVATLARAEAEPARIPTSLRNARRLRARIAKEENIWATAVAAGIDARIAILERTDDAPARIEHAEHAFVEAEMPLHAAALLRERGRVLGGDEGMALVAVAHGGLEAHGIVDPARMSRILIF